MIGLSASVIALIFSSLGSVYSKVAGKAFDKKHLSAYIGLSVMVVGVFSIVVDPLIIQWAAKDEDASQLQEDIPFLPDDLTVISITLLVAILGSIQQFCNIGKDKETFLLSLRSLLPTILFLAALQLETPSKVSMIRALNIPFSFALDLGLMGVPVNGIQIFGAILVFLAILVSNLNDNIICQRHIGSPLSQSNEVSSLSSSQLDDNDELDKREGPTLDGEEAHNSSDFNYNLKIINTD